MTRSPGRPRRASQEMLQEAAFELFQLRGYRGASVEQIAKTAGFSRATFFNFFSSKAELFWLETDALIASLGEFLEARLGSADPGDAPPLDTVLLEFAGGLTSTSIPWALQNFRLLEATDDLVASGAGRVLGLNRLFQGYLSRTAAGEPQGAATKDPVPPAASARAAVLTSLLLAALMAWIDAGVRRGSLREHLERALIAGS